MQAAILREFKAPLSIEEVERPKPGAHDVLIQVEACGVCHSDLHVADGDWPQLVPITKRPLILGHEIAGRAVEKGASVSHLQVGDRVGVPWDGTDPLFGAEGLPCAATMANPAAPFACFVNPFIVQNNQYTSAGSAVYQAGILEIKKRFSGHFTVFGNYTYSKGFDTTTDFNSDYGPQDPTNLGLDRALSEFDQRHKVVVAGVIDSPWKNPFLAGFQLAPIFTYNSGHPFNLLAGGEVNGNNHTTNERPIGAGRDTGIGPDYTNLDMRLSWQHKVSEKAKLLLTAESFNTANHTNYASVNNEVSPLFGIGTPCPIAGTCATGNTTFNVHGSAALSPSQPLGFTAAFPKREIQLGLRLTF